MRINQYLECINLITSLLKLGGLDIEQLAEASGVPSHKLHATINGEFLLLDNELRKLMKLYFIVKSKSD